MYSLSVADVLDVRFIYYLYCCWINIPYCDLLIIRVSTARKASIKINARPEIIHQITLHDYTFFYHSYLDRSGLWGIIGFNNEIDKFDVKAEIEESNPVKAAREARGAD